MARTLTLVAAAVAATLWGLAPASAQDEQRNRDPQRGAQSDDAQGQQDQQAGQQQTGQQGRQRRPGAGQSQPGQIPGQPGQAIGQQGAQASTQQVEQDLAACLALGNYSEISLSQLAVERAQNPEVKKFAQKMVQDHTQALNQLKQMMPNVQFQEFSQISQSQSGQSGQSRTGQANRSTGAQSQDPSATSQQNRRNQDSDDARSDLQQPGQAQPGQAQPGQRTGGQLAGQTGAHGQQHSLMIDIARQACNTKLEMTKEMLSEKQGAEFDKCYIGAQVMQHVAMVSELKAIESKNLPQLQGFAKQALPKAEEHLEMAQQIAKRLEGEKGQFEGRQDRRPGAQGSERRSSESSSTDDANSNPQNRRDRGNQNRTGDQGEKQRESGADSQSKP